MFFGVHVPPPDSDFWSGLRVVTSTLAAADVILIHSPLTKWKSRWHSHCGFSPLLLTRHLSFLPHCTLPSADMSHDFKCVPSSLSEKDRRQYMKDEWNRQWAVNHARRRHSFSLRVIQIFTLHAALYVYLERINEIRTFLLVNLIFYEKLQKSSKIMILDNECTNNKILSWDNICI